MRELGAALRAAVDAAERTVRIRLSVDWDDDGHGGKGSIDDLSKRAASVAVSSVLQGTQPDQVAVVEGTGAATLAADLVSGETLDERVGAVQYFSAFTTGPLAGKVRLARPVECDVEFLTAEGWQGAPLLRGRSRALPVSVASRSAKLDALDNRTRLRTPVTLPAMVADAPIYGSFAPAKPGLEGGWVTSYVLWQCGFPLSPPPPDGCRIWAPLHGSAMPFIALPFQGSPVAYYDRTVSTELVGAPLTFEPGPYFLALAPDPDAGNTVIDYTPADGPAMFASTGLSNARITCWVKAAGSGVTVFIFRDTDVSSWSPALGLSLMVGGATTGPAAAPTPVPNDGAWHLVGAQWDDAAGRCDFFLDGVVKSTTFTPSTPISGVADTWSIGVRFVAELAELTVSTGLAFTAPWPDLNFEPAARVDRSQLRLDGIASADPTEGWLILGELAAAEQGAMYCAADGTPTYATRARLVSDAAQVVQRQISADSHLFDLAYDLSLDRVANIITVPYSPIVLATQVAVWTLASLQSIDAGNTLSLLVDYEGGLATAAPRIVSGLANSKSDGTGTSTVVGAGSLPYVLTSTSETTATVAITNLTGHKVWLVGTDGQPNLLLRADLVSQGSGADPPVHVDQASRDVYGDQPLSLTSNRWVQSRPFAAGLAMGTAGDLAEPSPVFQGLPIPGDPSLEPFDRLHLSDPDNTGAALDVWYVGGSHAIDASGHYVTTVVARPARDRFVWGPTGKFGIDLIG